MLGRKIAGAPSYGTLVTSKTYLKQHVRVLVPRPPVPPIARPPIIVSVSSARVIFVEVFVQVTKGTMIRAVLGAALETFLMSSLMCVRQLLVKPPVLAVTIVVI